MCALKVFIVFYKSDASSLNVRFKEYLGVISGTVVNDNDFKVRVSLAPNAFQCPHDQSGAVIGRDYNREDWKIFHLVRSLFPKRLEVIFRRLLTFLLHHAV